MPFAVAWYVSLSSVCRRSHWCTLLRLTDLDAIWLYTCVVQRHVVLDGVPATPPKRSGDLGSDPQPKPANCKLQPNRRSYAATWRMQTNDSAFCQITLIFFVSDSCRHYLLGPASFVVQIQFRELEFSLHALHLRNPPNF